MKDSLFQKKIYREVGLGNGSILINAAAGSGKTTTILKSLKFTKSRTDKVFLAFNNSIVDELKEKIKDRNIKVSTMHSLCWSSLMRHYNFKVKLDKSKTNSHINKFLKKSKIEQKKYGFVTYNSSKILDLIRLNLIDVDDKEVVENLANFHDLEFDDEIYDIVKKSLVSMNKDKKVFDFTDMIYRAIIDNVKIPRFDFVYVDECQDLSMVQHEVIKRVVKKNGRVIAVGDPRQAIYGFAGADSSSFNNLKNITEKVIELPLNENYRCGKEIIKRAQKINPNIIAFKGSINGLVEDDSDISLIESGDWVICRNVKPLVFLNMYLTLKGKKSFIKGRDIGFGLENYIKKLNCSSLDSLEKKFESEILSECSKLKKKGVKNPMKTEKIDKMSQRYDMVRVLSENCLSIKDLLSHIRSVFKDEGDGICLTTIHKSKGLENRRIFFLAPELIPNRFAVMDWQLVQEQNLEYVGITRAKEELHFIPEHKYEKIEKFIKKKIEK